MNKKFLLTILLITAISTAAFAQTIPETEKSLYPYPYYNDDFPDVLVLKGVAVSGEEVKSAIFLATDRIENYKFESNYLILGGKSYELELDAVKYDEASRTAVIKFTSGDEILKLVIKIHHANYQEVVTASGVFDGHILNLRLVGENEPIYRIMQPAIETRAAAPSASAEGGLTSSEMAAIEEALK